MSRKVNFFTILVSCITFISAQQSQKKSLDSIQQLDEIILKANTILGSKYVAQNRTGAAYFLSTYGLNGCSMYRVFSMRKVQSRHVHSSLNQLRQNRF